MNWPAIKRPRLQEPKHLAWIRTLPCVVSGNNVTVQAAHVRYGDPRFFKPHSGIGEKPDDRYTVPLSSELHLTGPDAQHDSNEREWWKGHGIDPVRVAIALWVHSGDIEAADEILRTARWEAA